MRTVGCDQSLDVLPFDYRGSFQTGIFRAKVAPHVNPGFSGA